MMYMQIQSRRLNTLMVLAALLCLLLLLNFPSTGINRNGGDEDGGSGMGGTGRQSLPGSEGGIGGTGIKPFLGYSTAGDAQTIDEVRILLRPESGIKPLIADLAIPRDAAAPELASPVPRSIEVIRPEQITRNSAAIDIAEAIQRDIDANALLIDASSAYLESRKRPAEIAEAEAEWPVSWASLAKSMEHARGQAVDSDDAEGLETANSGSSDEQRLARPDTIQRPVLPPLQRVRPIQRAGLLPPPIRPLRL